MTHPKCNIYEKLLKDIDQCERTYEAEIDRTECAFRVSFTAYDSLIRQAMTDGFSNNDEKQKFFKTIKPRLAAKVEYYMLVYHFLVFQPPVNSAAYREFYLRELQRISLFLEQHSAFCAYYQAGRVDMDDVYFANLELSSDVSDVLIDKKTLSKTYDALAARLLALLDYHAYVNTKLPEQKNIL